MRARWAAALIAAVAPGGAAFGHADHVDGAAWTASLADACEFTDHDDDVYRGSCRLVSGALLCVRNRPIETGATASDASDS